MYIVVSSVVSKLLSHFTPLKPYAQKPPKGQRAPREDLSPYTAEDKVERRKARAREYSTIARKRQEAIETAFKLDLGYMRSFRVIMEEGPHMVAVVAPDLEANVLYANGAFHRALAVHPKRLLGRSLWNLLHQADHLAIRNALISVVLSKNPPPSHVPCRVLAPRPDMCLRAQVSLAMGTQGVICNFWQSW
jgi:PAS domain-containing protein